MAQWQSRVCIRKEAAATEAELKRAATIEVPDVDEFDLLEEEGRKLEEMKDKNDLVSEWLVSIPMTHARRRPPPSEEKPNRA